MKTSDMERNAESMPAVAQTGGAITISELKKSFDDFSLHVDKLCFEPGIIHGLIGPNGCGKTTLMKLIAGLISPDSGTIDYGGLTQRDITMVPRKPYFLHDSVYRNLVYPLSLREIKPDRQTVDQYLELAGLIDLRDQYAPSLSSGQQQKLSIIRALIFSPKLILIDEAFSNLDIESIETFRQFILERQQSEPVTWIVVSHQLSHIQYMCGHVCFMCDGKIETEGPVSDILFKPESEKLKKYLQLEMIKAGD